MKALRLAGVVCLIGFLPTAAQAGWPLLKFWKKPADVCVDDCCEEVCVSDCCDDDPCVDGCCDPVKPILFSGRLFKGTNHWLSSVCGDECCEVDLCCDTCCDDPCCELTCTEDSCCQVSFLDLIRRDRSKWLAEWIYQYETSCSVLQRCRAIHRIGTDFRCDCYPEVMCVLMHAMRDCEARVRVEAADEIGDQLRKSRCCCNCQLICTLKAGLQDCNWRVRRESAQALRLCGYSVPYRDGRYCVEGCVDGCCDGCCDGCVDGCCPNGISVEACPSEPLPEAVVVPKEIEKQKPTPVPTKVEKKYEPEKEMPKKAEPKKPQPKKVEQKKPEPKKVVPKKADPKPAPKKKEPKKEEPKKEMPKKEVKKDSPPKYEPDMDSKKAPKLAPKKELKEDAKEVPAQKKAPMPLPKPAASSEAPVTRKERVLAPPARINKVKQGSKEVKLESPAPVDGPGSSELPPLFPVSPQKQDKYVPETDTSTSFRMPYVRQTVGLNL